MIEIVVGKSPKIIKKGDYFSINVNVTNGHEGEITLKEVKLSYQVGFVPGEVASVRRMVAKERRIAQLGMFLLLFKPIFDFFGFSKFTEQLLSYQVDLRNPNGPREAPARTPIVIAQSESGPVIIHRLDVKIQPKAGYREDFGFKAGWPGGLRPRPDTYTLSGEIVYEFDNKTYYKSHDIEVSIFPSMGTMLAGTLIGSVLGTVVRVFTGGELPKLPTYIGENFISILVTLLLVNLILGLLIGITLMRKKDVQPFLTVEDFWGGILLGFLVGYLGIQFLFQFGNVPPTPLG